MPDMNTKTFKTWSEAVPVLQKIGIQVQVEETNSPWSNSCRRKKTFN